MRPKKRKIHKLLYTEIAKSGTYITVLDSSLVNTSPMNFQDESFFEFISIRQKNFQ